MEKTYTTQTVSNFIKLYDDSQRMGVKKDVLDYELGKIIVREVLLGRNRAKRNQGSLESFRSDLETRGRKVSIQSLHNYKHLFLGAHVPEYLEKQLLSREYLIRLGEICDDMSVFSVALAAALRDHPVLTADGSADEEMLAQIQEYVAPVWNKLPWNPMTWDLIDQGILHVDNHPPALYLHVVDTLTENVMSDIRASLGELASMVTGIHATTGIYVPFFCVKNHKESDAQLRKSAKSFSLLVICASPSGFPALASAKEKKFARTQKTFVLRQQWIKRKEAVLSKTTPAAMQQQQARVLHGKSQEKLKDPALFLPGSVDVVITDPPYGEKYSEGGWRGHTKRSIDTPETPEQAAALAAEIAGIILEQQINKTDFAYFQFMPLNHAHVFVPPLLAEFDKRKIDYKYQLWIWDKMVGAKTSGNQTASPRCEGIAYINVGRPLTDTLYGDEIWKHNPLLQFRAEKTGNFWKPVALIEHLIRLVTYEDESKEGKQQLILDPFAGRGSTGVAAINCKRDFRLIESNADEYGMCQTNILEALAEK